MADQQNPDDPNKAQPSSLPVFWKTGGKVVSQTRSRVHLPTAGELESFSSAQVRTCGECKHFRGDEAPSKADASSIREMVRAAVHVNGWKRMFFGHQPEDLRRCREDAELAVGPMSRACSRFTPRR